MALELVAPHALLLAGLTLGAFILCAGVALGIWFGRRREAQLAARRLDDERVSSLLRSLFKWTGSFSEEIAEYRSVIGHLGDHCRTTDDLSQGVPLGAPEVVSKMAEANERLQRRLNTAEATLRQQTEEIAGYLTEARSDALTGMPNRRAFDDECSRRLAAWRRYGTAFSIVLVDVDHFKAFNDKYGHLVGDKVLRDVAKVLQASLRDSDFAARFGGEEFALVLPAVRVGDASEAGERIRSAVAATPIICEGQELRVTVSCGVAQALQNEELTALIKRADQAMYAAKRSGRNNAHWHDGLRCVPVKPAGTAMSGVAARHLVSPNLQEACLDLRKRLLEVAARESGPSA